MNNAAQQFCKSLQIDHPVLAGAMYPCSNPELVAAVSQAGGLGIVQPVSLTYVYGYDFREGLRYIRSLTDRPIGLNLLVEKSSQRYLDRLYAWLQIALEENVRFFVTALGNPQEVCKVVHASGGIVFHNTTESKWAEKALAAGVDGLIAVNNRAGGHAGVLGAEALFRELSVSHKPVIAAGGLSNSRDVKMMLDLGYSGVQLGTRFIASSECQAPADYKQALIDADERDIVLTNKLSGVPVSVINTPFVQRIGAQAGPLATFLLRGKKTKKYMRMLYTLKSFRSLKRTMQGAIYDRFLQAGKSVAGIQSVESVSDIMADLTADIRR